MWITAKVIGKRYYYYNQKYYHIQGAGRIRLQGKLNEAILLIVLVTGRQHAALQAGYSPTESRRCLAMSFRRMAL